MKLTSFSEYLLCFEEKIFLPDIIAEILMNIFFNVAKTSIMSLTHGTPIEGRTLSTKNCLQRSLCCKIYITELRK